MLFPRFVSCCLLVFFSNCSAWAEEGPLLWKFAVGDQHHYRMTQNMDMEMVLGAAERKVETSVEQVMDMTWEVEKIDADGVAAIVQTMDRIQMDMQAPGQPEMHYDTDSEESPAGFAAMLVPLFKAMTAEPFKVMITPRGEITDLKMSEALTKAMQGMPGAAMMGEMFSDEGFKNMMQKSSLVLPKPEDLTLGHEWIVNSSMKNAQLGEMKIETTYRYLGTREVKGKPFEVFSIGLKMDFGDSPNGVQMEVVSHESNGEIFFSREAGRLESSTLQQEMVMKVSAGGQEISQTMLQKMVFERVDKKPENEKPEVKKPLDSKTKQ